MKLVLWEIGVSFFVIPRCMIFTPAKVVPTVWNFWLFPFTHSKNSLQKRVGIWGKIYLAVACGTVTWNKTKSEKLFLVPVTHLLFQPRSQGLFPGLGTGPKQGKRPRERGCSCSFRQPHPPPKEPVHRPNEKKFLHLIEFVFLVYSRLPFLCTSTRHVPSCYSLLTWQPEVKPLVENTAFMSEVWRSWRPPWVADILWLTRDLAPFSFPDFKWSRLGCYRITNWRHI